eukprot:33077-Rhodomonas_salina.9
MAEHMTRTDDLMAGRLRIRNHSTTRTRPDDRVRCLGVLPGEHRTNLAMMCDSLWCRLDDGAAPVG